MMTSQFIADMCHDCLVRIEGDDRAPSMMRLGEFCEVNEFDRDEVAEIIEALEADGEYCLGGGAGPLVTVYLA
jgi:hypothetical protein